jgi:hypothetical protein
MEGKIGGLFSGTEQVGGILDWKFEPIFADSSDGINKNYKFVKWTLTAPTYWLFWETGAVTVRLYFGKRYWEGEGNITILPRKVYDTMVHEKIEIVGEGTLVGKE